MTNEAILAVLDYLSSEAAMVTGAAHTDQLLRSIGDVRDLLTCPSAPALKMEEFDIVRSVTAMADILNLASGKRMKQVVLDALPPSLVVTQDRRAVEQLLTRTLDCALKLAGVGDGPLRLRLAADDQRFELAITNANAGLAHCVCQWLNVSSENVAFENPAELPFGLALMVAGRWLRAMGGAAVSDGQSTVSLDLPSCALEEGDHLGGPDVLNVLVAEDNDECFVLAEAVLREERVWRARDGQEALRMIRKQHFDIILMDIHMPGMDGYDVIRRMRDWETQNGCARTPIVVLSADDLETQQHSAAEFGCSGFVRKPVARSEILPLLERLKQEGPTDRRVVV